MKFKFSVDRKIKCAYFILDKITLIKFKQNIKKQSNDKKYR